MRPLRASLPKGCSGICLRGMLWPNIRKDSTNCYPGSEKAEFCVGCGVRESLIWAVEDASGWGKKAELAYGRLIWGAERNASLRTGRYLQGSREIGTMGRRICE